MKKLILALVTLLFCPALSLAQQRNAFIDPSTGVLKAVGYVDVNGPGEIKIPVDPDFDLKPGAWQWDGKTWIAVSPVSKPVRSELFDLTFAIDNAVASSKVPGEVKDVLLKLKKFLERK